MEDTVRSAEITEPGGEATQQLQAKEEGRDFSQTVTILIIITEARVNRKEAVTEPEKNDTTIQRTGESSDRAKKNNNTIHMDS